MDMGFCRSYDLNSYYHLFPMNPTPRDTKGEKRHWLSGYYPQTIECCIERWSKLWSMGPSAEVGWIWFDGNYTEKQIKRRLKRPPKDAVLTSEYFND